MYGYNEAGMTAALATDISLATMTLVGDTGE